jgi:uncharacterized protein
MSDAGELITGAYDAFARADIEAVLAVLSDRVEWDVTTVLPQGGSWRGREQVGEFFQDLGSKWADLSLSREQLIDDGDNVVAIGHAAGRLREHADAPAGYKFVHVFTVEAGHVSRFREWADPDEELREHSG